MWVPCACVENGVSPIPDLPSELCTAVPVTPIEVRPSLYLFSAWQVRGPLFSQRWYLHLLRNAINVQVGYTFIPGNSDLNAIDPKSSAIL